MRSKQKGNFLAVTVRASTLVAAASFMLSDLPTGAAVVTNGGFEAPDVASWELDAPGYTGITGWTVVGNTISFQDNAAFGGAGIVASEGAQFLELTGLVGRGGGVRSDAVATTTGAQYNLKFDIGAFFVAGQGPFGNVIVDVWINGLALGSFTNLLGLTSAGSDWETQSLDFVAAGAATTLEFRSSLSPSSSDLGVGLDNIRLNETSVPELGSLWYLGAGLVALALRRHRATDKRLVPA